MVIEKEEKMTRKIRTTNLEIELHKKLRHICTDKNCTMSMLIREMCDLYIKKNKLEYPFLNNIMVKK